MPAAERQRIRSLGGQARRESGHVARRIIDIGGMALVKAVVNVFYDRGLELVSRVNDEGDVTATTIDNRRIAAVRLRLDAPPSAYFFNLKSGLRVDLLFDFPLPASDLARRARRMKVRGQSFHVASDADPLRLKKIARGARSAPGDIEDIRFLEARRRGNQRL